MTFWTVRLIGKQYRFELGLSLLAAVVVAAGAAFVTARLNAVGVPVTCTEMSLDTLSGPAECVSSLQAFSRIFYDDGSKILAAMAILPIAVGLLGGVPIVGREIEAGTAQFSWAISPSRQRWLLRQMVVVVLILAIGVALAAFATQALESTRRAFLPALPFENVGLYGPIVLARMFAALMIGVFVGALTGRTLPAFIIGALIMTASVSLTGGLRDYWASLQPRVVVDDSESREFDGQLIAVGWIDEAGTLISYDEGIARAPAVETDPDQWLWDHGYRQVPLGITKETAGTWPLIEGLGWLGSGVVVMISGVWVTSRRRPR